MNPNNALRSVIYATQKRPALSPPDIRKKMLKATPEEIDQWSRDFSSLLGGGAGLLLGPGAREPASNAYFKFTRPVARLLSSIGLNPYANSTFTQIADLNAMGRANPYAVRNMRMQMTRLFTDPRGGKNPAAAGYNIKDLANIMRALQLRGYSLTPQQIAAYRLPEVFATAEEQTRSKDPGANLAFIEKIMGPLSYAMSYNYPGAIEQRLRTAMRMGVV